MEEDSKPRAIERRTSKVEAQTVIDNLASMWRALGLDVDGTFMFDDFFSGMLKTEETLDMSGAIGGVFYFNDDTAVPLNQGVIIIKLEHACIFAIKAMKENKNSSLAWTYACQAHQSLGMLMGLVSGRSMQSKHIEIAERVARSAEATLRARKRWAGDPLEEARARARSTIKDAYANWKSRPNLYSSDASFAFDISNKIDTDEKGRPVYSADYIAKKLIKKSGE